MKVSQKHNKRRNSGLLYEFLVRLISTSLVEGDQQKSTLALQALKRYFRPGTELYKEFRLLHALMKGDVSNVSVVASIMSEAKVAARSHDTKALDREKSLLIRYINHRLDDGTFWDQPVSEYRMLATVQTLINDWRLGTEAPLDRVAQYEDQLTKWLTEAKERPNVHSELAGSPGENRLVFRLMMKKLNEKYGLALTNEQRSILKEYVFNLGEDSEKAGLVQRLHELKSNVLQRMTQYSVTLGSDTYMRSKLDEAKQAIENETLSEVNDNVITKFLLCMKLVDELESKE